MTEFQKEYERIHEQGKRWNANRAKSEEEGLKKFRALSELWKREREQKNISSNLPVISSVCASCGKEMDEVEHNYGTDEILCCIHCYNDAQTD